MLKVLGIVILNILAVVVLGQYFFPDLGLETDQQNQNMILSLLCMPSVFYIMDLFSSSQNETDEKQGLDNEKGGL
jgi:hypothetical protein